MTSMLRDVARYSAVYDMPDCRADEQLAEQAGKKGTCTKVIVPVKKRRRQRHELDPKEYNDGTCNKCGCQTPYCLHCGKTWCIGCEPLHCQS